MHNTNFDTMLFYMSIPMINNHTVYVLAPQEHSWQNILVHFKGAGT